MKKFKKIYVEITNMCNLNCSFCSKSRRKKKEMTIQEFDRVIRKIKPYTDYIYLHIKGEPLLHSGFDDILSMCDKENVKVNITTNGTLLRDNVVVLSNHASIRQINVSLHSENNIHDYFEDVFEVCKTLSTKMFISYRLWTLKDMELDEKSTVIVEKIKNYYKLSKEMVDKVKYMNQIKIDINTYVDKDNLFYWPEESDGSYNGFCYALKTHIGILSDGTVVPCCLDGEGKISLGNIYTDSLDEIFSTKRYVDMELSFKNNKRVENLCRNCTFNSR